MDPTRSLDIPDARRYLEVLSQRRLAIDDDLEEYCRKWTVCAGLISEERSMPIQIRKKLFLKGLPREIIEILLENLDYELEDLTFAQLVDAAEKAIRCERFFQQSENTDYTDSDHFISSTEEKVARMKRFDRFVANITYLATTRQENKQTRSDIPNISLAPEREALATRLGNAMLNILAEGAGKPPQAQETGIQAESSHEGRTVHAATVAYVKLLLERADEAHDSHNASL